MKILLAVDGSAHGDAAVAEVARRPWPDGSEVRVVSVAEVAHVPAPVPHGGAELYAESLRLARERAAAAVEAASSKLRGEAGAGLSVTTAVLAGSPARAVVEAAEEWGADLIVVGSHGRGFWGRVLLGSVSQSVASHARCSVEIARSPTPTAA
jgi:nucleotide-binding universal stress UspA family protein